MCFIKILRVLNVVRLTKTSQGLHGSCMYAKCGNVDIWTIMEYKSKQSADTKKVDMIELEVHMSLNFESSRYVSFTLHTVF